MSVIFDLSEKSAIYLQLQKAPLQPAGKFHPIDLPVVSVAKIAHTLGEFITAAGYGSIYRVKNSEPKRIYKAISQTTFQSGDEIRISKIASNLGVGPTFYSACVVEQSDSNFVMLEMEDVGKTLGQWMEALAEPEEVIEPTEEEKAFQEMIKKMDAECGFSITPFKTVNRIDPGEAIQKLYARPEQFYFELFSNIKLLAESRISYGDTNCGNIMPNHGTEKKMQLIDFDSAEFQDSSDMAAKKSINCAYGQFWFNSFRELSSLSIESRELISWFRANLLV